MKKAAIALMLLITACADMQYQKIGKDIDAHVNQCVAESKTSLQRTECYYDYRMKRLSEIDGYPVYLVATEREKAIALAKKRDAGKVSSENANIAYAKYVEETQRKVEEIYNNRQIAARRAPTLSEHLANDPNWQRGLDMLSGEPRTQQSRLHCSSMPMGNGMYSTNCYDR